MRQEATCTSSKHARYARRRCSIREKIAECAWQVLIAALIRWRGEVLDHGVALLVEDEPLVRLTEVDILREAGFWVGEAKEADGAFHQAYRGR